MRRAALILPITNCLLILASARTLSICQFQADCGRTRTTSGRSQPQQLKEVWRSIDEISK